MDMPFFRYKVNSFTRPWPVGHVLRYGATIREYVMVVTEARRRAGL